MFEHQDIIKKINMKVAGTLSPLPVVSATTAAPSEEDGSKAAQPDDGLTAK